MVWQRHIDGRRSRVYRKLRHNATMRHRRRCWRCRCDRDCVEVNDRGNLIESLQDNSAHADRDNEINPLVHIEIISRPADCHRRRTNRGGIIQRRVYCVTDLKLPDIGVQHGNRVGRDVIGRHALRQRNLQQRDQPKIGDTHGPLGQEQLATHPRVPHMLGCERRCSHPASRERLNNKVAGGRVKVICARRWLRCHRVIPHVASIAKGLRGSAPRDFTLTRRYARFKWLTKRMPGA